ncbi:MAG TPA: glycosyltransferase family 4 protein [Acidimicrobiia bacterium]|nr:glycosyltransferase family 4 protein [Acidimicrobiia bacterium]
MTQSVLFFCGQPLVAQPISQRVAAFGAHLAAHGWDVRLTAVDPAFDGTPYVEVDPISGLDVEIIGPTHYRVRADGSRVSTSPVTHLRECRETARRLRERATEMRPDRVLISTTHPSSLYALGALRRSQSLWLDSDDWSAAHLLASGGGKLAGGVYDLLERVVPRGAQHITVCSNELAGLLPHAMVVPNFIRLREVPARPRDTVAAGTKVRVTFPGSITTYYGHLPLLGALARRRSDCDGIDFRVIGAGAGLDDCRRLVAQSGLDDVVTFTGRLDRAAMLDELVRADVSVLPLNDTRLDRARFPLKMLDALASGCALAASDVGMVHDTLTDGETALLSPPGDMDALVSNVLELAADPDARRRLSKAGLELVREYDEDVVCGRWMALLS